MHPGLAGVSIQAVAPLDNYDQILLARGASNSRSPLEIVLIPPNLGGAVVGMPDAAGQFSTKNQ